VSLLLAELQDVSIKLLINQIKQTLVFRLKKVEQLIELFMDIQQLCPKLLLNHSLLRYLGEQIIHLQLHLGFLFGFLLLFRSRFWWIFKQGYQFLITVKINNIPFIFLSCLRC